MTNPLPPTDSPAGIADGEIEELERLIHARDKHIGYPRKLRAEILGVAKRGHSTEEIQADGGRSVVKWNGFDSSDLSIKHRREICHELVECYNALPALIARLKHAEAERDRLWKQHMTLISHDNAELRVLQLESERDRLREALEPFAKAAPLLEKWHDMSWLCADNESNDWPVCERRTSITVEDIRMAAAALADAGKGGGE